MIAVVQRVLEGRVEVEGKVVGEIGVGMLVLVAVEVGDEVKDVGWMAGELLTMRIFQNGEKYFDWDVGQLGNGGVPGGILLVSNFTVAADTSSGRRPSLSQAAPPGKGQELFEALVAEVRRLAGEKVKVETGMFGADMRVSLVNDGPVTFLVETPRKGAVEGG